MTFAARNKGSALSRSNLSDDCTIQVFARNKVLGKIKALSRYRMGDECEYLYTFCLSGCGGHVVGICHIHIVRITTHGSRIVHV